MRICHLLLLILLVNSLTVFGGSQVDPILGSFEQTADMSGRLPPAEGFSSAHLILGFTDSNYINQAAVKRDLTQYLVDEVGPDPNTLLILPMSRQGIFPLAMEVLSQPEFKAIGYRLGVELSLGKSHREVRFFDSVRGLLGNLDAIASEKTLDSDSVQTILSIFSRFPDQRFSQDTAPKNGIFLAEGGAFSSKFLGELVVDGSLGRFKNSASEPFRLVLTANHNPRNFFAEAFVLAATHFLENRKAIEQMWPDLKVRALWNEGDRSGALASDLARVEVRNRALSEGRLPYFSEFTESFMDGSTVKLSLDSKEVKLDLRAPKQGSIARFSFKFINENLQLQLQTDSRTTFEIPTQIFSNHPGGLNVKISALSLTQAKDIHLDWQSHGDYRTGLSQFRLDLFEAMQRKKQDQSLVITKKNRWLHPDASSILDETIDQLRSRLDAILSETTTSNLTKKRRCGPGTWR